VSTPSSTETPAGRTHTLQSACAVLPLLRSIARDVHETYVRLHGRLRERADHRSLESLTADAPLPDDLRDELADLHEQIAELTELGARLGDPGRGVILVDAVVDGHPGTLCWKIGEPTFRYWFPVGESYDTRRPIDPAARNTATTA